MRVLALCVVVGTVACGPVKANLDYAATPRLPSPTAGSYVRATGVSPDPVVVHALGGRASDVSLTGAASGLALAVTDSVGGYTQREVREAAFQAGYPYPIERIAAWTVAAGAPPPAEVGEWLATVPAGADLGLVRARGHSGDTWVGLWAQPRVDVGLQPRQAILGESLALPAVPGATYEIADPDGRLRRGELVEATSVGLDVPGEWVVRVVDGQGTAAWFATYVGVDAPLVPLIPPETTPLLSTQEAVERASALLDEVRQIYGRRPWQRDAYLDAAARSVQQVPGNGVRGLGDSQYTTWHCSATSVEDCLDHLLWEPDRRAALVSDDLQFMGLSADVRNGRLELLALIVGS